MLQVILSTENENSNMEFSVKYKAMYIRVIPKKRSSSLSIAVPMDVEYFAHRASAFKVQQATDNV
jgi:hypothetical protein